MNDSIIGYIVGGSLKEGFIARLTVPAWQVQEGSFVVAESGNYCFYGLVTDIRLGATDPRFAEEQSEIRLPDSLASLLHGQTLYADLVIMPALMQNVGPDLDSPEYTLSGEDVDRGIMPVKTLPAHHAIVRLANAFDVQEVFGDPNDKDKFAVGTTREQGHPVAIDFEKFIQRSAGIFGATGTGKSYLTRMILAGLINSQKASVLVFDMHDEYAFGDTSPDTGLRAPGLKEKLGSRVKVCALGTSTDVKGHHCDFDLVLERSDIEPDDILMLSTELNLRETTANTLAVLEKEFGPKGWFTAFMAMGPGDDEDSLSWWAERHSLNIMAVEALHTKLIRVNNRRYLVDKGSNSAADTIISALKGGFSVILSFGKYESDLDYLLVTNILTRKIRASWEEQTGQLRAAGDLKPQNLVIAIEEAHKLLNREMAGQTAFAVIAREMRKYYVTLLVIDQRPSQIYDEVMSQLGTRISGWLGNDNDISAVLSGLAGKDSLRGMLARLQPKEEVLLLGYGVPMPLPIRSRRYDEDFWRQLLGERANRQPWKKGDEDPLFD